MPGELGAVPLGGVEVDGIAAVEDVGGFHIEDLMMVTEKGPKLLSTATSIDEMYVIE